MKGRKKNEERVFLMKANRNLHGVAASFMLLAEIPRRNYLFRRAFAGYGANSIKVARAQGFLVLPLVELKRQGEFCTNHHFGMSE